MKFRLLFLILLAFGTALMAFRLGNATREKRSVFSSKAINYKNIIRCTPDWDMIKEFIEEADIPPVPGAGNYKWKISTQSDSAQFYFNQGINMYYSFHIIEAMASFKKAQKFDPTCAMLYWAEALAYGPNINDIGYSASPEALIAAAKAVEFSGTSMEKEKLLIQAQKARYSADTTEARQKLNQVYADLMKEAYDKFNNDADVAALYADALMLQHPWDLWKKNGTPQPWTAVIRNVLEKLLEKTPDHPGANHYYIHVMEPSPYPDKALASADRLGRLTPGLSHTVHMPSHIYLRTGQYNKGVLVNENAVSSYKKLIPLYPAITGNDFLYIIHNLHMQTNNSMLEGRSVYSVKSAIETMNSIPKDYLSIPGAMGNFIQYVYMTSTIIDVRFGRWNELLNSPKPDASMVYANILYHFGRGMALGAQSKLAEAKAELASIQQLAKDSSLYIPFTPFSPAIDGTVIAANLLAGSIALHEKNYDAAISAFSKAVTVEEGMVYNEPRDWMLNPGPYLGNAYLQAGRFAEAEKAFLKDLSINNENGWSLYGLYQSLLGQNKKADADKTLALYKKAFQKADVKLTSAVF